MKHRQSRPNGLIGESVQCISSCCNLSADGLKLNLADDDIVSLGGCL